MKYLLIVTALILLIAGSVGACEPEYKCFFGDHPEHDERYPYTYCDEWRALVNEVRQCQYDSSHVEHKRVEDFCDATWDALTGESDIQALGGDTTTWGHSHDNQYIERIDTVCQKPLWLYVYEIYLGNGDTTPCYDTTDHRLRAIEWMVMPCYSGKLVDSTRSWAVELDTTWADKPERYVLFIDTLCVTLPFSDSVKCDIYDTTWVDYCPLKLTKKQADKLMDILENWSPEETMILLNNNPKQ